MPWIGNVPNTGKVAADLFCSPEDREFYRQMLILGWISNTTSEVGDDKQKYHQCWWQPDK